MNKAKSGPKKATPVTTDTLCGHGCGQTAKFLSFSGKYLCGKSTQQCPVVKEKNSKGVQEAYDSGKLSGKERYENLPQEVKDRMSWSKGLTKETDQRVANLSKKLTGRPGISRPHTEEAKKKISKTRTEWLKKSENRKNLGRHKRSWLESTFETYLNDNKITGWDTEVHFWSEHLHKNFYPDFIFEDKSLIIELDGTQHRKTVEQDTKRDAWFHSQGYTVVRITVEEFKKRHFSGQGFMDLLGR